MNRRVYAALLPVLGLTVWAMAQTPGDPLIEGLRNVEVASVADAIEQLYGQKAYMSHDMRPVAKTKFAGPAVTVLLKKEEHKEGSKASQGMLDAIDAAPPGSVYVMVLEDGLDYAGMGALMATAMKVRGLTGAVIDGGVRDTPQIGRIQFPVFSRYAANRPHSVPGIQPGRGAVHHDQSFPLRRRQHCGDLRGRQSEPGRYHRGRRGWGGGGAESARRGCAQEGRRVGQHGAHHAALHREVQIHQGSRGEVRADLRRREKKQSFSQRRGVRKDQLRLQTGLEEQARDHKRTHQTIADILVSEWHGVAVGYRSHLRNGGTVGLPERGTGATGVMAGGGPARLTERAGAQRHARPGVCQGPEQSAKPRGDFRAHQGDHRSVRRFRHRQRDRLHGL